MKPTIPWQMPVGSIVLMTLALCIVLHLALAQTSFAATAAAPAEPKSVPSEVESPDSSKTQASTNKKKTATNPNKKVKKKNEDIFRPSEEISEDFAVSFPVDI
ncbi:MAG: hypothetical protein GXP16_16565 [Gammaproteobacteria bacterium]|nr:hypothetical protein [Gammaproteobacteria bacterium]